MKGAHNTKRLRELQANCHDIVPVFGALRDSDGKPLPLDYRPRNKFDPKPWELNGYRYASWELEAVPQHQAEVTDAAWIEQRHSADLDGSDTAFTHMFDREINTAGVAA
jgi:hypothetical protein